MILRILKQMGIYLFAAAMFLFTIFPFYWIVVTSLRPRDDIFASAPKLLPTIVTFENYVTAFTKVNIGVFIKNSLYVTLISIILSVIIASFGAYALGRMHFRGENLIKSSLVVTQMFPLVVLFVPLYMFCRAVGLYNTLNSLIIPYVAIQVPVCTVLMINYFSSIPKELDDSAMIDGCNRFQTFIRIIFPLAAPGIAATSIYSFVGLWQEFMLASGMLAKQDLYTLTVGLGVFRGQHSTDWGGLMATSVVIALPSLLFFTFAQNYFINNMAGGIKE